MKYISSSSLNVIWSKTKFFKPSNGIKQVNLFSLYFFVICIDKLSYIICDVVAKKKWNLKRLGRSGPYISHLMFMDDLIFFVETSVEQINTKVNCLNLFCASFGQKVNHAKSHLFLKKCLKRVHNI